MKPDLGTATLLVFTLGPRREGRRRRLLPRRLGAHEEALHQRCLDSALAAGREAGLRLVVSSPEPLALPPGVGRLPQSGRGFGERLRRALRQAVAASDGPVLVVGTDTPGLTAGHLRSACRRLGDDPDAVVAGPSPDGGFYLLAAARPLDEQLAAVRWCRRDTLRSLRRAVGAAGRGVSLLPLLEDLDRASDLDRWLSRGGHGSLPGAWRPLRGALRALLAALRRPSSPPVLGRPRLSPVLVAPGRAPPA